MSRPSRHRNGADALWHYNALPLLMVALAMAIAVHFTCVTVTALLNTTLASLMLLGCPCASAMSGALRGKCFSQNVSPMTTSRAPCKVRFDWGKSRHRYGHLAAQVLPQKEQTKRESDSSNTTRTERILRVARAVGNNSHWMCRRWITRIVLLDDVSDALVTAACVGLQGRRSICIAGFLLPFLFFTLSLIHLNPYSSLQKWGPETGAGRRPLGWHFGLELLPSRVAIAPQHRTSRIHRTRVLGKDGDDGEGASRMECGVRTY